MRFDFLGVREHLIKECSNPKWGPTRNGAGRLGSASNEAARLPS